MSVINTNITSMIAQQNLNSSKSDLTTSMERLSSGLRINSAKDDAAGQAIANRMSSQITGLGQAQRNANDGISVAQTAEGALNQVNDNLQRIRELSVQAANDTNSADDRASIQAEIDQRLTEIDRISSQTDFNGTKVLAEDTKLSIQVGANDGESISISLKEITSKTLGMDSFNVNGPQGTSAAAAATNFKDAYGDSTSIADSSVNDYGDDLATTLGIATGSVAADTADAYVDESGNWYSQVTITAGSEAESRTLEAQGISVGSGDSVTFSIALDPQDADVTTNTTASFTVDGTSISASSLVTGATDDPMAALDSALSQVDTFRSDLGAIQNRFESAITNLQTNETNLSAARSRIEDADYATEVANMTRSQILQQAGTSVLAQANQMPQSALSLLG
ncbi:MULTISPECIES: FliC/FljB family flagellin [unclassified Modicisalibacter]|uniref:FliC/FljB family flagellin n=1 Tax=unclassified Modicisalibacter TaxID=2679913 RepID=UPI001CCB848D|nr:MULTISPECIES: FliC/FljB family flagellin [unclassified Modicisalibacter]MBZ9556967.1 FliC/FljB family flagellin [Modicisalibacter sp. R2A 31.J]MBZ9574319.1 FliC/FljB family flagellin [Modicisalibacter sp. MOD 31.J]